MLMQMLRAGGVPLLFDAAYEQELQARFPQANLCGFFELQRKREHGTLLQDGWAVKLFPILIPQLVAGQEYQVILIERPEEERLASYAKMRGVDMGRLSIQMQHNLFTAKGFLATQEIPVLALTYEAAIASPDTLAAQLRDFLELPQFDVKAAAQVIKDKLAGVPCVPPVDLSVKPVEHLAVEPRSPCRHLGALTGEKLPCQTCQAAGTVKLEAVHVCAVFVRCTITRQVTDKNVACCANCGKWEARAS